MSEVHDTISPAVRADGIGKIKRAWQRQQQVARRVINWWDTENLETLRAWNVPTRTPLPRFPRKVYVMPDRKKARRRLCRRWPGYWIYPKERTGTTEQPGSRCTARGLEGPSRSCMNRKPPDGVLQEKECEKPEAFRVGRMLMFKFMHC